MSLITKKYSTKKVGSKYSQSYKIYITENDKIISPFHDIPCFSNNFVTCINEIPRFEHGKFEISKEEKFNPIKQDTKKGKMRFIDNIFPAYGYPFNYGAIPQTWEDPTEKDEECGEVGDNDPIDVIEIGSKRKEHGEVYTAKVLGCLALLDDNETDWKIMVIDSSDPMAEKINSLEDVEKYFPKLMEFTFKWFKDYKIPTGKPENKFAFDGRFLDAEFALKVIKKAHLSWNKLIKNGHENIAVDNCVHENTIGYDNNSITVDGTEEKEADLPDDILKYFYV